MADIHYESPIVGYRLAVETTDGRREMSDVRDYLEAIALRAKWLRDYDVRDIDIYGITGRGELIAQEVGTRHGA